MFHTSAGIATVTAATGSATVFKTADLVALVKALPAGYRTPASWLINAHELVSLHPLTDSAGTLVFPTLQAYRPALFGRPAAATAEAPPGGVGEDDRLRGLPHRRDDPSRPRRVRPAAAREVQR